MEMTNTKLNLLRILMWYRFDIMKYPEAEDPHKWILPKLTGEADEK